MEDGKIPTKFLILHTLRQSWRYLLTEWRFQLAVSALVLLTCLFWAWRTNRAELFSRAGAILALAGTLMTFRFYLRGAHNSYLRDTGIADQPAFRHIPHHEAKMKAPKEDYKAICCGIICIVLGTIVWAYGDVMIRRLHICAG